MPRYLAACLLPGLLVVACQDSLSPPDYVGSYQLLRVNATALPVAIPSLDGRCTLNIGSGSVVLSASAFTLNLSSYSRCLLDVPGDTQVVVLLANPMWLQGSVTWRGDTLDFIIAQSPPSDLVSLQAQSLPPGIQLTSLDEQFGLPLGTTLDFGGRQSDGAPMPRSPSPYN